jgi:hypothetical protein
VFEEGSFSGELTNLFMKSRFFMPRHHPKKIGPAGQSSQSSQSSPSVPPSQKSGSPTKPEN